LSNANWVNDLPRLDVLKPEQEETVHDRAMRLLEEIGLKVGYAPALELLRAAGVRVDGDVAHMERGFVLEQIAKAPKVFDLRGRDRRKDVTIGGNNLALSATGGAPFTLDPDMGKRPARMADYLDMVKLMHVAPQLHVQVSGVVEPDDLPVRSRHLDMDRAIIRYSDKPYFAVGATAEGSADAVELASIAFGGREAIRSAPVLMGIVNPVSPLQYDDRMGGSLVAYSEGGQCVVLMPYIMTGGTAPLGFAGALAQSTAESLAGAALVQVVRPGCPVVLGGFVAEMDLRSGQPMFGTPGSGAVMLAMGQMARRYGLPQRGGGAFTAERQLGVRATMESVMTIWPTLLSGANLLLHAVGWIDGSLCTSIEKMADDLQFIHAFEALLANRWDLSEEGFAMDAFREVGPGGTFLGAANTLRHFREAAAAGDVPRYTWRELLDRYEDPGIDPAIEEAMDDFIARRRGELERVGA
jgi:trimethylamine--corrinoid protein Co-methyltransferase